MSVWRRFDGHGYPSHVTTVIAGRRPIFGNDQTASHLCRILHEVVHAERAFLLAFAVMPDHLHLVVSLGHTRSLGRLVQLIKGRFAREHNLAIGSRGSVWQDRYHERALRTEEQLLAAVQYVLYNPVTAGLAANPEDYKWCSADGLSSWSG